MDQVNILRRAGLFDAKVPRYTSYPPANRFEHGVGQKWQRTWLSDAPADKPISIYVHIPFCRRLCWFCACRTQGTKTLGPVEAYVTTLLNEIDTVADLLPNSIKMGRLHLGGGTPTLLSAPLIESLLERCHRRFAKTDDFEFSVEVDPIEAPSDVLDVLARYDLRRASIGVQDFDTKVQDAIGRQQSFDVTYSVAQVLRGIGVQSLNIDFLYGLPFQTAESLVRTIDQVVSLSPDRLALYGYAHVPHVSKRQVMIPEAALPSGEQRFVMSQLARDRLTALGYLGIGIDHFALHTDSLAQAAKSGDLSRNFQGYTDDTCDTLIGFGASAISKFSEGYLQNAVSTSAYQERISLTGIAGHKGVALSHDEVFLAYLVGDILCKGALDVTEIENRFPSQQARLNDLILGLKQKFPELVEVNSIGLSIYPELNAAARLVAAALDNLEPNSGHHSIAV